MWSLVNKIRQLFSPKDKWKILLVTIAMIMGALLEILSLGCILPVIAVFVKPELIEQNQYLSRIYSGLGFENHLSFIIAGIVFIWVLFLLKTAFTFFTIRLQANFVYRKQGELYARLLDIYLHIPYRNALALSVAEMNTNINRVDRLCNGFILPLMVAASDMVVVLILATAMLCFIPWLTIVGISFISAVGYGIYYLMRNMNLRWGQDYVRWDSEARRFNLSALTGLKYIKTVCAEKFFLKHYAKASGESMKYLGKMYLFGQLPRLTLEAAALLLVMVLFLLMVLLKYSDTRILLTSSMLIVVMARILPAFSRMHYNLTIMRQSIPVFESLFQEYTQQVKEEYSDNGKMLTLEQGLSIRNLSFGYDGKQEILHDFSCEIPARKSVAVVGKTGRGKTTLADLVIGLLKPRSGEILADGVNIEDNMTAWRNIIAYVPQQAFLLDDSIRANIAFGIEPERIDDAKVVEALKIAQLGEYADKLDFMIGDRGVRLSGGQAQRLSIARALYRDPQLLILDEATSALDNTTEAAFVAALEQLKGKLMMIVIAHRLTTVEKCDQVIDLDKCN